MLEVFDEEDDTELDQLLIEELHSEEENQNT
jgi:hypothetical protein